MKLSFLLIILFIIYCSAIFCQQDSAQNLIDKQLQECLASDKNYTTSGMLGCEIQAKTEWDAELNKYYKLLMKILLGDEKAKLKAAQKNWLNFRDAETAFASTFYNNMQGTMWNITNLDVDVNVIKQRALELKAYYNDKATK